MDTNNLPASHGSDSKNASPEIKPVDVTTTDGPVVLATVNPREATTDAGLTTYKFNLEANRIEVHVAIPRGASGDEDERDILEAQKVMSDILHSMAHAF